MEWFLVYSQTCTTMNIVNFSTFLSPQRENLYALAHTDHSSQSLPLFLKAPDNHSCTSAFMDWICLFSTFHI